MQAKKVSPQVFQLTSVAGRVGLLAGITAGTVSREEVEAAVLADTEKRPYRKPVVAEGKRYNSVTDAALALVSKYEKCVEFNRKTRKFKIVGADRARAIDALKHRIARYCNADNVEGFYWSE